MQTLIFGPPGTGKTTRLLDIVDGRFKDGVKPYEIGYISYTRKAIKEAKGRAWKKFGLGDKELPYFKTLHSLAFHLLGMTTERMFTGAHLKEFAGLVGHDLSENLNGNLEDGLPQGGAYTGDLLLSLVQLARAKQLGVDTIWRMYRPECTMEELIQFRDAYTLYKQVNKVYDYTDLLESAITESVTPKLDTLIIDEAQDLYPLQWAFAHKLMSTADKVYIGGDPDQAIYEWAGADPRRVLALYRSGKWEIEHLKQSYRLPQAIHGLAMTVIDRCEKDTYPKVYRPRNASGNVEFVNSWYDLDFGNGESWYLLGRNTYLLSQFKEYLITSGLNFSFRHHRNVDESEVHAIICWERLRKGVSILKDDVLKVYDFFVSGKQVKRGAKTLLTNAPEKEYSIQDLKTEYGLLIESPWYESLYRIPEGRREYYRAMLRRGYKLTDKPRIHVDTIHGVKGGEAENVLLLTDMAKKSFDGYMDNADAEHRVFYVGMTRAKQNLYIVSPQGNYSYIV